MEIHKSILPRMVEFSGVKSAASWLKWLIIRGFRYGWIPVEFKLDSVSAQY